MKITFAKTLLTILLAIATTAAWASRALSENVASAHNRLDQPTQLDLPMQFEIDGIVKPAIRREKGALVIAISNGHNSAVYGYGHISDARADAPDGETMFEIASLSKLFTALILSTMVQCGQVSLTDPVQRYMPWPVQIPTYAGSCMTLADLATYTSGLPRMPIDRRNAWSPFSTEQLYKTIGTYKLNSRPGSQYAYSNLGYVILGQALANKAEQSYERLLQTRITDPLKMRNTVIKLTPAMEARFAQGHDRQGQAVPRSIPMGCGASGGIRSCANDLLKFLSVYLDPKQAPPPLPAAINETLKPRAQSETAQIGLAWEISKNGFPQKTGLVSGYRSFIGFAPKEHVGVIVLTSSIAINAPTIGRELLAMLTHCSWQDELDD